MPSINEGANWVMQLWGGFGPSRVLLTANNLGIFDYLAKAKTAAEVAKEIKIDTRATEILMNALTGLRLLKKTWDKYRNTIISNRFLVSGTPYYQGDIIKHGDDLWKSWSDLDKVIKKGEPFHIPENHRAFIKGMHNLAILKVKKVIHALNLQGVKAALDLGGGPGTYAMEIAKKGVTVTLFDLPETINIARKIGNSSGVRGIKFVKGNFLLDHFGKGYDLIFVSQVFHSFSEKENIRILKRSKEALNPQGRIAIQEFYIDEDRSHPVQGALFSINMLVQTKLGRCYTRREIRSWLTKTGFRNVRSECLDDTILIQGTKGP